MRLKIGTFSLIICVASVAARSPMSRHSSQGQMGPSAGSSWQQQPASESVAQLQAQQPQQQQPIQKPTVYATSSSGNLQVQPQPLGQVGHLKAQSQWQPPAWATPRHSADGQTGPSPGFRWHQQPASESAAQQWAQQMQLQPQPQQPHVDATSSGQQQAQSQWGQPSAWADQTAHWPMQPEQPPSFGGGGHDGNLWPQSQQGQSHGWPGNSEFEWAQPPNMSPHVGAAHGGFQWEQTHQQPSHSAPHQSAFDWAQPQPSHRAPGWGGHQWAGHSQPRVPQFPGTPPPEADAVKMVRSEQMPLPGASGHDGQQVDPSKQVIIRITAGQPQPGPSVEGPPYGQHQWAQVPPQPPSAGIAGPGWGQPQQPPSVVVEHNMPAWTAEQSDKEPSQETAESSSDLAPPAVPQFPLLPMFQYMFDPTLQQMYHPVLPLNQQRPVHPSIELVPGEPSPPEEPGPDVALPDEQPIDTGAALPNEEAMEPDLISPTIEPDSPLPPEPIEEPDPPIPYEPMVEPDGPGFMEPQVGPGAAPPDVPSKDSLLQKTGPLSLPFGLNPPLNLGKIGVIHDVVSPDSSVKVEHEIITPDAEPVIVQHRILRPDQPLIIEHRILRPLDPVVVEHQLTKPAVPTVVEHPIPFNPDNWPELTHHAGTGAVARAVHEVIENPMHTYVEDEVTVQPEQPSDVQYEEHTDAEVEETAEEPVGEYVPEEYVEPEEPAAVQFEEQTDAETVEEAAEDVVGEYFPEEYSESSE